MPTAARSEKIRFAKEQYKNGVTAPAQLQAMLKEKFGSGMSFMDLGSIFPKKPGAKKKAKKRGPGRPPKATAGRGPGRPRKKARRGGRPTGWSSDQWLLVGGEQAETFGSKTKLQNRVARLMGEGVSPGEIAVYEKTTMTLTVKTAVTL